MIPAAKSPRPSSRIVEGSGTVYTPAPAATLNPARAVQAVSELDDRVVAPVNNDWKLIKPESDRVVGETAKPPIATCVLGAIDTEPNPNPKLVSSPADRKPSRMDESVASRTPVTDPPGARPITPQLRPQNPLKSHLIGIALAEKAPNVKPKNRMVRIVFIFIPQ